MKQIITLLLTVMMIKISFGQITTTKIAPKVEQVENSPYDSTENFLGLSPKKYIGQEFYLKGLAESLRRYGYSGFALDYNKSTIANNSNVYKCCDGYNSKYTDLAGKYFTVLDVIKHPRAATGNSTDEHLYGSKWFIKLKEKESGDIVYFEYSGQSKYFFPFIVVGYFEKSKNIYIGKEYILRGRNWVDKNPEMYDIRTGKPVDYSAGTIWKCVDFTIEEKYYNLSLIIESSKGERLSYSMDNIEKGNYFGFLKSDSDKYKTKFGAEKWSLILAGQVKIGMTKEMCELSWEKPKEINQTITAGKKNEQWVYDNNYLYFDNGVLSAMQ